MLKQISCDKFLEKGKIREPIVFHPGLNTVMGSENAANSIGKSTFLLIVDFIFGGSDYVEEAYDIVENVGHHTIKYEFVFDNQSYYFSRSTDNSTTFNKCDSNYTVIKRLDKEAYCHFLKQKYKMNYPFIQFRASISPFIRAWGRETIDNKKPLKAAKDSPDKQGIDTLLRLFNRYSEIEQQKKYIEDAEDRKKVFVAAQKYKFIATVQNKTEYKDNEKRIQELEQEINQLTRESDSGLVDLDSIQAQQLSELRHQLSDAKRQRSSLLSQKRSFEAERNPKRQQFQKDFESLQQFFPNVDIKTISEIESFHQQLTSVLSAEYQESAKSLQNLINLTNSQVYKLEEKISQISTVSNVSQSILEQYADLQREITQLRDSNESFKLKEKLSDEVRTLNNAYNQLMRSILDDIEDKLNSIMSTINDKIYDGAKTSPKISLNSAKSYDFYTPQDRGTGSEYKGLILFDLAMLKSTSLPINGHDSFFLKQIQDEGLEGILKCYLEQEKQVFITFDKEKSYSEECQKILKQTEVLRLYPNGGELFGSAWNNKLLE
ncbi:TPA: DUF2326 domain-containing protein [Streptococcus suis]|nr:DUF2326 domain-containing protein [Streptococcus suis]